MSTNSVIFPPGFIWGAATSSYQIEGGANEDGRAASVWDHFGDWPGKVWNGDSGQIASDHYHRSTEDVALMKQLGIRAYRFSLSWPRVVPDGTGAVNAPGLDFYDRLVDDLLAAGISPWVTLYHWDHPGALQDRGGWLNPEMPRLFAAYTQAVVERLSDRVTNWFTLNEPQCFIGLGLESGLHAPGLKCSRRDVLRAGHHALLAHGRAVETIREFAKSPPRIGWAPAVSAAFPATETEADISAAREAMFSAKARRMLANPWDDTSVWANAWWSDPVVFGHYPEDELQSFGKDAPAFTEAEMKTISAPIDFLGANVYHGMSVRRGADNTVEKTKEKPGGPRTHFNWPVSPQVIYWAPRFLHERYKLPIIISENGMANPDWVDLDGKVQDPQRIDFTRRYLRELNRAIADGVDVRAYFHWSLMDNFEWAEGYKQRFGLIHVDFETLKRTPKSSYHWYKQVIETNGAALK